MPDAPHRRGEGTAVVLYDGLCGLCNRWVRFLLKRDVTGVFRFASLQSPAGRELLSRHGIEPSVLDSFYLVEDFGLAGERVLYRSTGAIHTAAKLGGIWKSAIVLRVLPQPVRDFAYDTVARNRFRWFGQYDTCPLPDPAHRGKFLDHAG